MKTNPVKHPAATTITLALSIATAPATTLLGNILQLLPDGAVTAAKLTSAT